MNTKRVRMTVLTALFSALIFLGTYIIRIPSASGYVHTGDGFVFLAAALLPASYAIAASAVGGALSDLIAGYVMYVPITIIVKALAALAVGQFLRTANVFSKKHDIFKNITAALIGGAVNMAGYFLAETMIYGIGGAVAALGGNAVQAAAGLAVFILTISPAQRALRNIKE